MRTHAIFSVALVALVTLVAQVLVGCGSAPPPLAPDVVPEQGPLVLTRESDERPDQVPRSVKRLLAEKRHDLEECESLVGVVGDGTGRRRADAETAAIARELARIESAVETWNGDSDSLDAIVAELQLASTHVGLLREKLRTAAR